jgi:hypothetical protein
MSFHARREPPERFSCARCDGEVFLLARDGRVVCAGCRMTARELRVASESRFTEAGPETRTRPKP